MNEDFIFIEGKKSFIDCPKCLNMQKHNWTLKEKKIYSFISRGKKRTQSLDQKKLSWNMQC